jgi:hypothetical protein
VIVFVKRIYSNYCDFKKVVKAPLFAFLSSLIYLRICQRVNDEYSCVLTNKKKKERDEGTL